MVIGKTSKKNFVILTLASLIFLIGSVILFVLGFVIREEGRLAMFIISPICLLISIIYSLVIIIEKKKTNDAIIYDENRKIFILNKDKISIFNIKETKRLYRDMPIWLFNILSLPGENEYGTIIFILNDGTKIKSLSVQSVDNVYRSVNDIIDRKNI